MALCTVAAVRAKVYSATLSDSDITAIIADVSTEVLERAGTTSETSTSLQLAGKYAACAACLRRMRTTGELAASVTRGNAMQQNTIDKDIQAYEDQATYYIRKFKASSHSIIYGRVGPNAVNEELE